MPPKYGLIKMQGFAKGQGLKGAGMKALSAPKAKPLKAAPAFGFGDGGSDDEGGLGDESGDAGAFAKERSRAAARGIDVRGVNADLLRQQAASSAKVAKLQAQAVAEGGDAVFAYDEVYDDMVADKDDKLDARKKDFDPSSGRERKDSRYIAQLKKSAEIRKVDDERIFQMKLKKEADAEAHIYGDKEKFVTTAYKEKLAEMGRWKAEDSRLEALETATTVEGKTSMTGFYANLMTKNLAMGTGDISKDATSAYTIGSARNEHIRAQEAAQKAGEEKRLHAATAAAAGANDQDDVDEIDEEALLRRVDGHRDAAVAAPATSSRSAAATAAGDGEMGAAALGKRSREGEETAVDSGVAEAPSSTGEAPSVVEAATQQQAPLKAAAAAEMTPEAAAAKAAAEAAAQKAARDAATASARERFLARKMAKKQ